VRQQLVRGQIARLTPIQDRLGDVRGEVAEADEPREVGRAHTLPLGECGERQAVAADECDVESACPDQQFDQPRIGFRCRKWVVPAINILIARPERRNRTDMAKI